jgi:hypothetical protein
MSACVAQHRVPNIGLELMQVLVRQGESHR